MSVEDQTTTTVETTKLDEDPEKKERFRRSAKGMFTRYETVFFSYVLSNRSKQEILNSFHNLGSAFKKVELSHDDYVVLLEDEEFEDESKWMDEVHDRMMKAECAWNDYSEKIKTITSEQAESQQTSTGTQSPGTHPLQTSNPDKNTSISHMKFQTEKTPLPKFSGELINYYEFRNDFKFIYKNVNNSTTKQEALYVLKTRLDSKVKIWIDGELDYDEAWKILDNMYGDARLVSDAFLNEIQKIKTLDELDSRMNDLYRVVKKAKVVLAQIDKSQDLDNSTSLAVIEKKFHSSDRAKWAEKQRRDGISPSLENLLKFMEDELWIRQRSNAEIRSSGKKSEKGSVYHLQEGKDWRPPPNPSKCWFCDGVHKIPDCPEFKKLTPSVRLAKLREKRGCYFCLRKHSPPCRSKRIKCSKTTEGAPCQYYHHELLHGAPFAPKPESTNGKSTENSPGTKPNTDVCATVSSEARPHQKLLPVISVKFKHDSSIKEDVGNVLMDSGSELSLVRSGFARQLGLKGQPVKITLTVAGGDKKVYDTNVYQLEMCGLHSGKWIQNLEAYGIPEISHPIPVVNLSEPAKLFNLDVRRLHRKAGPVDLLIGIDHVEITEGVTVINGQYAYRQTVLGPIIFGTSGKPYQSSVNAAVVNHIMISDDQTDLSKFWTIESMGTMLSDCCTQPQEKSYRRPLSISDKKLTESIVENAKKIGNQWTVKLPWKLDPSDLPNNYCQAKAKMISTEIRLQKSPQQAEIYDQQIRDLVTAGSARILSKAETSEYRGPVFYISHHAVYRDDKPSHPCRLVFNSACPYQGHVMNNYLHKGGDHLNDLIGVIFRWRENLIAILGDVSKMYHQVRTSPGVDEHTHRFLWRNYRTDSTPDIYVVNVLTFGDVSSPAIANVIMDLSTKEFDDFPEYSEASCTIRHCRYMDDIADSVESTEIATIRCQQIDEILAKSHFKIKEWISNGEFSNVQIKMDEKVLGVNWDCTSDEISVLVRIPKKIKIDESLTKRLVLSRMASVFDILGMAAPVIIRGKILMQNLWINKIDWDEKLSEECSHDWKELLADLHRIPDIKIGRCVTPENAVGKPQLITFSDSSSRAFGSVSYLRWKIADGQFSVKFLIAKTRVAPTRQITLARLELLSAVLAARLTDTVKTHLRISISECVHFTDSMICLGWITNESRLFPTFIANRIGEIQSKTRQEDWEHLPSKENVADDLTRGLVTSQLGDRFLPGPSFLFRAREEWPRTNDELPTLSDPCLEAKCHVTGTSGHSKSDEINLIGDTNSWTKAIRIRAFVRRFLNNYVYVKLKKQKYTLKRGPLSIQEEENARIDLVKSAQNGLDISKLQSLAPKLNNQGVLIAAPRTNQLFGYETYEPPILPRKSIVSKLITLHFHKFGHHGPATCSAKIRRSYWIVGVHRLAKWAKNRCVFCREMDAKTELQLMADLPPCRLQILSPVFFHTAVDLFGPIRCRYGRNKTTKVYGVLFTCLSARAVYIDVAEDYSTPAFLQVLRRFFSIRGYPHTLWSDRGTQLVGADNELRLAIKGWDKESLRSFCHERHIQWNFFTPTAAHQNGCTEALIKTCKKALKRAIGEQRLSPLELQTVLFEVSNLMNSRPIGRLTNDPDDGYYMSPNDLLLGRASTYIPQGPFLQSSNPRHRVEFCQKIVDSWWKIWERDVFPHLVPRQKWKTSERNVRVGDFVLLKETNPIRIRGSFSKGLITAVFPGRDNRIRNVRVKTEQGEYERPITRIVVIHPVEGYSDDP